MIKILDHGYLKLVETWGSDERIIEAARLSTQKGFEGWDDVRKCPKCEDGKVYLDFGPENKALGSVLCQNCGGTGRIGDEKLLKFMWENKHSTPFEFGGAVIEVQAPIFVFREWHRHRTQSYSEASARYSPLPDVNYIPAAGRIVSSSEAAQKNKQAGKIADSGVMSLEDALEFQTELADHYDADERFYQKWLKRGVVKELARIKLPVGRYTKMRAAANLRNWLWFEGLRQAPNAQEEIRVYANCLHDILAEKFPRTLALFDKEV